MVYTAYYDGIDQTLALSIGGEKIHLEVANRAILRAKEIGVQDRGQRQRPGIQTAKAAGGEGCLQSPLARRGAIRRLRAEIVDNSCRTWKKTLRRSKAEGSDSKRSYGFCGCQPPDNGCVRTECHRIFTNLTKPNELLHLAYNVALKTMLTRNCCCRSSERHFRDYAVDEVAPEGRFSEGAAQAISLLWRVVAPGSRGAF